MNATYLIIPVALLLLLAGCAQEAEETVITGQVTSDVQSMTAEPTGTSDGGTVRDFELLLKQDMDKDGDIASEYLFPPTINVQQGDTVKLVFLLDEPRFIEIDGYAIAEKVQNDVIEFVADKEGSFSMLCLDCENSYESRLVVS